MLPNLDKEDRYLLLPSVFGATGLASVLVDALRVNEGIIEVLDALTLAARARDDFVGVVTALGRPEWSLCVGDDCMLSVSELVSRDAGRAEDISSLWLCLARLPGDAFSSRSPSSSARIDLKDFVRERTPSGASRPAFDGLRFRVVVLA